MRDRSEAPAIPQLALLLGPDSSAHAPRLDGAARRVFSLALQDGALETTPATRRAIRLDADEFDRACALLVELRLLRPAPDDPGTLVPMNPEVAAAELAAPLKAAMAEADARVRSVSAELAALMPEYQAARRRAQRGDPIQVLPDPATVAAMLAQEMERCREEVFSVSSDGSLPAYPADMPARDLELLRRGVRLRTLFRLTARPDTLLRDHARRLMAAGAEYRGAPELPGSATLLDRTVAFIPRVDAGGVISGTLLIRDAGTVAYLWQVFDHLWRTGTAFDAADRSETPGPAERANGEVRRAVVRMLAEGAKDEMIARRLGISLRTCRRHIADILDGLHAESRFQAGVLAERAGLTASVATATADPGA